MTPDQELDALIEATEGHTEGPWTYRPHEYDDWGLVRRPARDGKEIGYPVANASLAHVSDDEMAACRADNYRDPVEANARLIAAAPDFKAHAIRLRKERDAAHSDPWGPIIFMYQAKRALVGTSRRWAMPTLLQGVWVGLLRDHADKHFPGLYAVDEVQGVSGTCIEVTRAALAGGETE